MTPASLKVKLWRIKNPGRANQYNHTWYVKNKAAVKVQKDSWRKLNKAKLIAQGVRWKQANPEKVKASMFKTRYGAPFSVFENLFRKQKGLCAICRKLPAEHTDHDHASGKIRGLLCRRCNWAIGLMKDSPKRLIAAAKYLIKNT